MKAYNKKHKPKHSTKIRYKKINFVAKKHIDNYTMSSYYRRMLLNYLSVQYSMYI